MGVSMTSISKIPLGITAEARDYVAELKLDEPLRQMLEHIQNTVKGVRAIQVKLAMPYDLGDGPRVIFDVKLPETAAEDRITQQFTRWQIEHFPPEVFQHFVLLTAYE